MAIQAHSFQTMEGTQRLEETVRLVYSIQAHNYQTMEGKQRLEEEVRLVY